MDGFFTEIRDRRVLPAVGVYVASVWVLIEILDRLESRYLLSPYLTDIAFWGLFSLVPAVMVVAWTHGRPGKDRVTRLEKLAIPLNLIATIGLLLTVFGNKDLSLAATKITLSNELGQQETHFITSETFRRRMAVFFWKNESDNSELDWLQYGITELLVQDLQQDPFVLANSPWNNFANGYYARMSRAGFTDGLNVPVSLMQKIADRANRQYFVEGSFSQEDDQYVVTARIWKTDTLDQVSEITERGWDIYTLIDRISKKVRDDLDVPDNGGRIAEDLPLAETYGESEEALKAYIAGLNARLFDNDFEASNKYFEQATTVDPNFVLGWFLKAANMAESGDLPGAQAALTKAQQLDYRLPVRDRSQLKFMLYRLSGEHEKLMAFLRLQARIHDDSTSHDRLAGVLMVTGELEEAKQESLLALERDALNVGILLRMSALERATGNMDAALEYAFRYQEQRPEDIEAQMLLGDLFRDRGDLDAAEEHYKQALVLQNSPVRPVLKLAIIAARKGDFSVARDYLTEAEGFASTPAQKVQVRQGAAMLEERLGRISEAIRQIYAQEEFLLQSSGQMQVTLSVYTPLISYYIVTGKLDEARQALETAKGKMTPPVDKFLAFSEAVLYANEDRIEAAREALMRAREVIEQFQLLFLNIQVSIVEGIISETEEDYESMLANYRSAVELIDQSVVAGDLYLIKPQLYAELASAQIEIGQLAAAEKSIAAGFLLDPSEPALWVAQGRLKQSKNMLQLALASVNYALAIWKDADTDYHPVNEARDLASTLQAQIQ